MTRRKTERLGLVLGPVLGLALWVGGCAGAVRPHLPAEGPAVAPWDLPANQWGRQSLFRLHVEGPEGEATLRLLLRLSTPTRFQLVISDRLGRAVYGLETADGVGRLIDHQHQRVCPLGASFELEGVPLDPVPLDALPALLLGRVPAHPAAVVAELPLDGEAVFEDARGRRWSVTLEGGEPVAWSLSELSQPALWWRRAGRQSLLSDRVRGVQLSWEATLREPLPAAGPAPLVAPADYATSPCPPG